jgi:acetylglutamate kinase
MKLKGQVHSGMLPKLDNAFAALQAGVQTVVLGKADVLTELLDGQSGTEISL